MSRLTPFNHFAFMIPPLGWNVAFVSRLRMARFTGPAPGWLLVAENVARVAVVLYPLLLPIDTKYTLFAPGAGLYGVGLAMYFASWTFVMSSRAPEHGRGLLASCAPAYTAIVWLVGIAVMSRSPWYGAIAAAFIVLHVAEFVVRYRP